MVNINPNQEVNFHGVREQTQVQSPLDAHLEEFNRLGYTKLEGVLNAEQLAYYQSAIDGLYDKQIEECGGEELARKIGDADNIRCPLALDEKFLDLAINERLHEMFKAIMGDNYILMMQNGILNKPARFQHQTFWHRDLNYQHWTSSTPLVMNALYCIDDFTLENGGTVVLPGSHLLPEFPSKEFVLKNEIGLTAKAGDVLVMNSMMYHRTGYNQSNQNRRAVNHVIGMPFFHQQLDIPSLLDGKFSDDPFLNKFLGYRWKAPASVEEWRKARQG